ncbi:hypothetical protein GCM10023085_62040 [Actinomadura viridis]|uniref:Uncharacterized protein n=1 Tax=Actinomadura viridis TaxID=58110 RepID=A0A931GKP1_9ACTN|nr:hypothetical protein [Actinomadura viridis]MBG6090350.1 hypothetical protein [Actinomadura viridis]
MTFDLDVLLTMMPMPGGDVPLVFLDDAAATPVPRRDEPGEEVTALMAACLGGGLDLVTDMRELLVPLVPGWLAEFGGRGTLTVRSPRDDPARPFCRVERLGAPPGWAEAASRLGCLVLFAGSIAIAEDTASADARLRRAAATGMLASGVIGYRPG